MKRGINKDNVIVSTKKKPINYQCLNGAVDYWTTQATDHTWN